MFCISQWRAQRHVEDSSSSSMHNKSSRKSLHLKSTITKILTAYKKLGIIWFWPTNQCQCHNVSHWNLFVICHIIILKCYLIHVVWTISRLSFNIGHVKIQPSDSQELKIDLLLHQNKLVDCNWIKMIKSNQSCSLAILSATYPPMLQEVLQTNLMSPQITITGLRGKNVTKRN